MHTQSMAVMTTRAVYFTAYTDVHYQATVGMGLMSTVARLCLSQKVNLINSQIGTLSLMNHCIIACSMRYERVYQIMVEELM